MGRKTNPTVIRIGNIVRSWDAKWFSDVREGFKQNLLDDLRIRKYLSQTLRQASISRVEISRDARETVLTIHTSRPAVVIGRGGSGIEKIQKDLRKLMKNKVRFRINVQEVRNPDTDAAALATQVVDQLERRMAFRRVLKQAVQRAMQAGARGVRIALAGRLNGAEIARTEWLTDGNVPLHTFRSDISYAQKTAHTTYGTIGVKVWINRGDLIQKEEDQAPGEVVQKTSATTQRRRRSSLAEKVTSKKDTSSSKAS